MKPRPIARRPLTPRQIKALRRTWMATMKAQGCTDEQIASIFRLSPRHVRGEITALELGAGPIAHPG